MFFSHSHSHSHSPSHPRSLLCVPLPFFLAVLSFCSLSFLLAPVLVSADTLTNQLEVDVDRISATSARIRFYNAPVSSITYTLIQLSENGARFTLTRDAFHQCAIFSPTCTTPFTSEDREYNITQGTLPITSYILRGLKPSSSYKVRVAYIDRANPPQVVGTAADKSIPTTALSPITALNSLVASGGCGSMTSTGALYYLTETSEFGQRVLTCYVVSEISNVTLSVVPQYAYASIQSTPTSGLFSKTNQTLSVTAKQVDPLSIYTYTIPLGAAGTTTNFSFIVTSESGVNQTYTLSIRRVLSSSTSSLAGPSSPVTALIRSPAVPSNYSYRALLWSGTTVGPQSWKVWSDDLTVFPFSAFNITFPKTTGGGGIDYTLAQVSVSPSVSNLNSAIDGSLSCSNIYVGLFDISFQSSSTITTCVSALDDYCSATPFGAATKWQTFNNAAGNFDPSQLYHPAPPSFTFPAA